MLIKVWHLELGGLCHFNKDELELRNLALDQVLTFDL